MSLVIKSAIPLGQQMANAVRQFFGLKIKPSQLGQFTKSGAFEPTGYAGLSTGAIGKVASGRIVSTGVKVGIGTGAAGAGLAGLGYGLTELGKPISAVTDPIDELFDITGIGATVLTLAVIGIIILVLLMMLRRK